MFFYNNVMFGEKPHVRTHEEPQYLVWENNFYEGKAGVKTDGLKQKKMKLKLNRKQVMEVKSKLPVSNQSWKKHLPTEMLKRVEFKGKNEKLPAGVYFSSKGERGGLQEILKREDVGPDWK
jgi:poly(beta-D-mannuronate) lyase